MSERTGTRAVRGRCGGALLLATALLAAGGCVRRTISITSHPPGALVWLNDREIGRTPLDVEFLYYGTYDVRLEAEGHETLWTAGEARAPWWDAPGPDFVSEIAPWELVSAIDWHYELEPTVDDPAALVERARRMRDRARDAEPEPGIAAPE